MSYEWQINESGLLGDVIAAVEAMDMPRSFTEEPRSVAVKSSGGVVTKSRVEMAQVEHLPTEEDVEDFDRVRRMVLMELHNIESPCAGVMARYVANPPPQGGYSLQINVSAHGAAHGALE